MDTRAVTDQRTAHLAALRSENTCSQQLAPLVTVGERTGQFWIMSYEFFQSPMSVQ